VATPAVESATKVREGGKSCGRSASASLIVCYLAKQHQELIAAPLPSWNKWRKTSTNPIAAFTGDYLDAFSTYQERMEYDDNASTEVLTQFFETPHRYYFTAVPVVTAALVSTPRPISHGVKVKNFKFIALPPP